MLLYGIVFISYKKDLEIWSNIAKISSILVKQKPCMACFKFELVATPINLLIAIFTKLPSVGMTTAGKNHKKKLITGEKHSSVQDYKKGKVLA